MVAEGAAGGLGHGLILAGAGLKVFLLKTQHSSNIKGFSGEN